MGASGSKQIGPPEAVYEPKRGSPEKPNSPSQVREGDEYDPPRDLTMQTPVNTYRGEQGLKITQDTPSGTQIQGRGPVARGLRNANNQDNKLRNKGRQVKEALDSEDRILSKMRNPPRKRPRKLRL